MGSNTLDKWLIQTFVYPAISGLPIIFESINSKDAALLMVLAFGIGFTKLSNYRSVLKNNSK